MNRSTRIDTCTIYAATLIIAGLIFRLAFLGDFHFAFDESFFYDTALRIAQLRHFPVYGAYVTGASVRVPGGAFHYLMALPLFFSRHPYGPVLLVILLGSLGQYIIFVLFKRLFDCKSAIFVLIITTFNPFFVFFADSIWNPDVLIFFGALYLFLLVEALDNWPWSAFFLGALLAFLPQIHLSTVHLTILTAAFLAIKRPRLRWTFLGLGALAGLATYIPYFWVDFHHHFANTRALLHAHHAAFQPLEALRAFAYLFVYPAGEATYFIAKGSWFPLKEWRFYPSGMRTYLYDVSNTHAWGYAVVVVLVLGVLFAVASAAWWLLKGRRQENPLFTLYWLNLLILPVEFLFARKAFYPHYTIVLFALCLAPIAALVSAMGKGAFRVVLAAGVILALAQGITTRGWYNQEERVVGLSTFLDVGKIVCFDPARTVAFNIRVARTRVGNYPLRILCRDYFKHPKAFGSRSRVRYTLYRFDHKVHGHIKHWNLGSAILVKRGH